MAKTDFLHKESLTTAEALRYCRHMGRPLCPTTLYYHGTKSGFMVKSHDNFHWRFMRAGLGKFLMQKLTKAPEGWLSVKDIAAKFKSNLSIVYDRVKSWNVRTMRCGEMRQLYVNVSDYEKALERHRIECINMEMP